MDTNFEDINRKFKSKEDKLDLNSLILETNNFSNELEKNTRHLIIEEDKEEVEELSKLLYKQQSQQRKRRLD